MFVHFMAQPSAQPAKKRDTRKDRPGSQIDYSDATQVTYTEGLKAIEEEYKQSKPSSKVIRQLMRTTYDGKCAECIVAARVLMVYVSVVHMYIYYVHVGRRRWILDESPEVTKVLECFPALKKLRYVSSYYSRQ